MNIKLLMLSTTLALLFLSAATPGYAAVTGTIKADIPFSFTVANTTLPAGNYEISTPAADDPKVLEIRQEKGDLAVLFFTEDVASQSREPETELVFHRIGDKEFLSQVWMEGSETGSQLPLSKTAKKLRESGAKTQMHRFSCQGKPLAR
jgi:hypothetical protein